MIGDKFFRQMEERERPAGIAPFFVIGSGRSGTTLLRLMLNMHSRLRVPRESGFLIPLLEALPAYGPLAETQLSAAYEIVRNHPRWPDWECADPVLHRAIYTNPGSSLAEVIDRIFRECSGMRNKLHWGDKTPKNSLYVAQLDEVFPAGKFIHVVRDARDVYVSMREARWFEGNTRRIARYWSGMTLDALRGRALGPGRYLEIHYEALVSTTEQVLREVCAFLGVAFEEGMLQFYQTADQETAPWEQSLHQKTRSPVCGDRVGRWRSEISTKELWVLEAYAGETMRRVGQTPELTRWSRLFLPGLKALLEARAGTMELWNKVQGRIRRLTGAGNDG